MPIGEKSMSSARSSWIADRVTASMREASPWTPADAPASTDRIAMAAHRRHAWSAGYCPMRNRRRLLLTTFQRASVSAHCPIWMVTHTRSAPSTMVMIELIGPENRFSRSHAIGTDDGARRADRLGGHRSSTWTRRL